jgi:hypothetical protein
MDEMDLWLRGKGLGRFTERLQEFGIENIVRNKLVYNYISVLVIVSVYPLHARTCTFYFGRW